MALTFDSEKYSYVAGTGTRDGVENVGGISMELVGSASGGGLTEIVYANGQTALQKAQAVATTEARHHDGDGGGGTAGEAASGEGSGGGATTQVAVGASTGGGNTRQSSAAAQPVTSTSCCT